LNKLWVVAAVLFLAVAGVAAYKVLPLLDPEVVRIAALDQECDLRAGPCTGQLSGWTVLPERVLRSISRVWT